MVTELAEGGVVLFESPLKPNRWEWLKKRKKKKSREIKCLFSDVTVFRNHNYLHEAGPKKFIHFVNGI